MLGQRHEQIAVDDYVGLAGTGHGVHFPAQVFVLVLLLVFPLEVGVRRYEARIGDAAHGRCSCVQ